jgi:nicotinamidase-related amidase
MTLDKHTALLIIDMQNAYFNNGVLAERRDELVAACNKLIDTMLGREVPVILVRTEHKKDKSTWTLNMLDKSSGYLFQGADDAELVDGLHANGTSELFKTRDSAFHDTNLADRLRVLGIQDIIIAGVSTHSCILFTAADAYAVNFRVTLARDAIASDDPDYHESTLAMLKQEYHQEVLPTADIIV